MHRSRTIPFRSWYQAGKPWPGGAGTLAGPTRFRSASAALAKASIVAAAAILVNCVMLESSFARRPAVLDEETLDPRQDLYRVRGVMDWTGPHFNADSP